MSAKAVIGVIIVAILIGVLYVVFEKNFTGGSMTLSNSKSSSAQELSKDKTQIQTQQQATSLIQLPTPEPSPAPVDDKTDLEQTAEALEMRDYSGIFDELKGTVSQ